MNQPPDLDALTPRQLVAGLMRGDPATFKQGYTAENAVRVVEEQRNLTRPEANVLRHYAAGFADGLAEGRAK